jgi:hypothetical protein
MIYDKEDIQHLFLRKVQASEYKFIAKRNIEFFCCSVCPSILGDESSSREWNRRLEIGAEVYTTLENKWRKIVNLICRGKSRALW